MGVLVHINGLKITFSYFMLSCYSLQLDNFIVGLDHIYVFILQAWTWRVPQLPVGTSHVVVDIFENISLWHRGRASSGYPLRDHAYMLFHFNKF